ncbi:hypothetical protein SAMN02910265_02449 [Ruminococcus flavefaciens]|uniref:Uncharacterized protein n=1 Tax=Ruminococcus flavefaciens TaxID=1265 RepID=A0A1H6KLH2_RUMFL|nr:hypothetical protein [Ruminococcus flavefaciens]SEH74574.1 hypothetical protein SAMN02910265_02449 [Ruminococcus flavefaciens]
MKKLLILSLLIVGIMSIFSCSDNTSSIEELPAPNPDKTDNGRLVYAYKKIIAALRLTEELMAEIDQVVEF